MQGASVKTGLHGFTFQLQSGTPGADIAIFRDSTGSKKMTVAGDGSVRIGDVPASSSKFLVVDETGLTDNQKAVAVLLRKTSGDMTDGFGPTLKFSGSDDTAVNKQFSVIGGERSGSDDSGKLTFHTAKNGVLYQYMTLTKDGNLGIGSGLEHPLA